MLSVCNGIKNNNNNFRGLKWKKIRNPNGYSGRKLNVSEKKVGLFLLSKMGGKGVFNPFNFRPKIKKSENWKAFKIFVLP